MRLFSLRKSDVSLRNGKLSKEYSETPHCSETPFLPYIHMKPILNYEGCRCKVVGYVT